MKRTDALELANKIRFDRATWRRRAALQMHADGRSATVIAMQLGISVATVRRYIRNARKDAR
ncbi:MAG: sigma factor-like helix-turn-helix DNA-binding protein [Streptosporangiaceae bacterium]